MLIGLTGGYCAGKNLVAELLSKAGWTCIDVDKLGHEAVDLAKDAIVERFGAGVLGPDGKVDRRAVARIIFADQRALADQEAIIHPLAKRLLDERIAQAESLARSEGRPPRICVNAALLHRTEQIGLCDAIIEVRAPLAIRVARGMRRDTASARSALQRIWNQRRFRAELYAAARPTRRRVFALVNAGSRTSLERRLGELIERIEAARGD